jgi:uncharacterized protein YgbK (DUF1537 family)
MTWLGVVADDLTGACDLADAVCDEGASAVVVFGRPDGAAPAADCVVVGLKSRTAAVDRAVADSVDAARWLLDAGCGRLYQKYCSTFDSAHTGNIGPVADALRALIGAAVSVGTPATPRVGRTVYQGHLFVGRQLLAESPMRDHPLTPMRDSDLVAVLSRQTSEPVGLVSRATIAAGSDAVAAALDGATGHVLLDALDDADLDVAAAALLSRAETTLAGGAAGLAAALARSFSKLSALRGADAPQSADNSDGMRVRAAAPAHSGRQVILSGSCSTRTRQQVAAFAGPSVELSPLDLAADRGATVDAVLDAVRDAYRHSPGPVLVTSSAPPARVAEFESRLGPGRAAELLEAATAEIARRAVETLGVQRLLVAGGETSGAVVAALGLDTVRVGPRVAPGLSWMVPADDSLALLLKSGNFGDADLFDTAWDAAP